MEYRQRRYGVIRESGCEMMHTEKLMFRLMHSPDRFGYELQLAQKHPDGRVRFAEEVKMAEVPVGQVTPSMLHIEHEEVQQLMDMLWNAGIRPSLEDGTTGQRAAMQDHINTLKKHCDTFAEMARKGPDLVMVPEGSERSI